MPPYQLASAHSAVVLVNSANCESTENVGIVPVSQERQAITLSHQLNISTMPAYSQES